MIEKNAKNKKSIIFHLTKPYNLHIILNGTFYLLEFQYPGKVERTKTNERKK